MTTPSTPETSTTREKPAGIDGAGRSAVADAIAEAGATLDQQHEDAKSGKGKKGKAKKRSTAAEKVAFAADQQMCEYLLTVPFALSGSIGSSFLPAAQRAEFQQIWELGKAEKEIGGKALHILALRYGEMWAQYLPHIVLATVLLGGYTSRMTLSVRIIRAVRRQEKKVDDEREPNQRDT